MAALAVADGISGWTTPQLKWPNDVYAGDRKLCGILAEPHPAGGLVVGIGLNLTNDVSQVEVPAINLAEAAGRTLDPIQILGAIVDHCLALTNLLIKGQLAIDAAWRPYCWLSGKQVVFDSGLAGTVTGITPSGGLALQTDSGSEVVHGGVIQSIR